MMYVVVHCRHWEHHYAEGQLRSSISLPILGVDGRMGANCWTSGSYP